jgi:hypothetical protein
MNLDQTANIWCKKCLYGDSIVRYREARIRESSYVTDVDDVHDTHYHEIEEEENISFTFQCENCGNFSEEIGEIATSNIHEALKLWEDRERNRSITEDFDEDEG